MKNIALVLSYSGENYHGWQTQKNAISVQETLQKAIEKTTGFLPILSGCGRTDSGVHAEIYVANAQLETNIPLKNLHLAINTKIPPDISVTHAIEVSAEFDSRFDCTRKEYTYKIWGGSVRSPFHRERAYFYPPELDLAKMKQAAEFIVGTHDFKTFKNEGTPMKNTVRTVHYLECEQNGKGTQIRVCADGFLYNMVRNIAGTLIFAAIGKIQPSEVGHILASGDRTLAGPTAPPEGLYLTALDYEQEDLKVLLPRCNRL